MDVSLERATESDINTLIELEESVAGSKVYSAMLEAKEWEEAFESSSIFFIKYGDEIVGNISYELKGPDHLHISGLAVSPLFQGKGIARNVLTQLLAKFSDTERIDLVTHPDNPALKLYKSLGFEVESRKENYYGDGEPRLVLALTRDAKHR